MIQTLRINTLEVNKGQIEGLPKNPRFIKDERFKALVKSIEDAPEMLSLRELLVYPHGDKYVVIGGNMRLRACKELGYKEIPCKVLPIETSVDKLREYTIKDNNAFGSTDWDLIANEWECSELEEWGVEIPDVRFDDCDESESDEDKIDDDEDEDEHGGFYEKMVNDVLFDSNNEFEIPNLLLDKQARRVELPITPWGANSRLRKDVCTYHFYVDDYRFENLWKDPLNLINSDCKAIVEPNCSLHDQTPIAFGLQMIYKKRWLARYMQELGVLVFADLNVSSKFTEYNKMGIPQGYDAFFTRGLTDFPQMLESDLEVAKSISGKDRPNLVVYGGGVMARDFCMKHDLLYINDFVNSKK